MDIELLSTIVMVVVPLLLLVEGIVVLLVWAHLDGGMPWLVSGWRTPGREGVRGDSVGYWLIATTATALAGWIVSFISVHALLFAFGSLAAWLGIATSIVVIAALPIGWAYLIERRARRIHGRP
jgi:hypothetical protein